jgi:cytochrome c biogenesis protein CcmG/thiol:disulfide interchange protein DsbE
MTEAEASPSPRRRRAPFIALAVTLVVGGLFAVLATSKSATSDPSGLIDSSLLGKAAPAVRSTTLDGGVFDLAQRKGSWVVLNFFNSTCAPCRAEHAELVNFVDQQAQLGADAAEFYTVLQYDDSVNDVKAFFLNHGGSWPIVRDDDGAVNVAFGVAKVPETWVIDPSGIVRLRWAGMVTAEQLATLVQQERDRFTATGGAG